MKRLFLCLVAAFGFYLPTTVQAQATYAITVTACGSPPNTPKVGNPYPITQDPTGILCTSASGGGGGGAVTVADGADVTQGAKADAACATAATACTVNQRLAKIEQAAEDTTTPSLVKIDQTSTNNNVVVTTSALPSGAATAANQTTVQGTKAAGTAATNSELIGGVYNTALPTLTNGQQAAVQFDSSGRLQNTDTQAQTKLDTINTSINTATPAGTNIIGKVGVDQTTPGTTNGVALTQVGSTTVVNGGLAGSLAVGGTAAANASANANPMLAGCEFKTNTTAATTGQLQFHACDAFGNVGRSLTPSMATQITAQSATTANTANTATLAAAVGKLTYITGFACTAGGATAGQLATVTVAGIITGSKTYTVAIPTGATLAMTPLIVSFPNPIQSSTTNTAITVQIGAAGAGNTVEQCNADGYQQ